MIRLTSVKKHIEGKPFCIVTYHTDMQNDLQENMVSSMVDICRDICDELGVDYLEHNLPELLELTMYVQDREEGLNLIGRLMQSHIFPNPTDEHRAFWSSIFAECGANWGRGNRAERALLAAFRVFYDWMDCGHKWVEQEIAEYHNGKSYDKVLDSVMYAIEIISFGVSERWEEAGKHEGIRGFIPDEVLLVGNVTAGLNEQQILGICRLLAYELLEEHGIIE